MNSTETFEAAINCFGKDHQCDIAIEEMAELTKAILKERRCSTPKTKIDVIEEMADNAIMLEQLKILFLTNPEEKYLYIQTFKNKVNRLNQTILGEMEQREIDEQHLVI